MEAHGAQTSDAAPVMVMQNTFHWGKELTLFFSSWVTRKPVHYALVLVAVFIFAIAHQFLGYIHKLYNGADIKNKQSSHAWLRIVVGTFLYGVHTTTTYILMLIVMSFNGGAFLAVVFGLCTGFLIFQAIESAASVSDRNSLNA